MTRVKDQVWKHNTLLLQSNIKTVSQHISMMTGRAVGKEYQKRAGWREEAA